MQQEESVSISENASLKVSAAEKLSYEPNIAQMWLAMELWSDREFQEGEEGKEYGLDNFVSLWIDMYAEAFSNLENPKDSSDNMSFRAKVQEFYDAKGEENKENRRRLSREIHALLRNEVARVKREKESAPVFP